MSGQIAVTANEAVVIRKRQAVTKSSTATLTDNEVLSGLVLLTAAIAVTLPDPTVQNAGADLYLSASVANAQVVCSDGFHGVGSGADTLTLAAGQGCHVYCDGSAWYLLEAGPGCSLN